MRLSDWERTDDMNVIIEILKRWKQESGIEDQIQFNYKKGVLQIYTNRLAQFAGENNVLYNKYIEEFRSRLRVIGLRQVKVIETFIVTI